MAQRKFDDQDKRALVALDPDFETNADGEIAKVTGEMEVEIVRLAEDGGTRFLLTIRFPSDEEFTVLLSRAETLKQLGIGGGGDV